MSAPVDVLTIMREERALRARTQGETMGAFDGSLARVDAAIAAVAELIEANKAYDLALAALENFYRTISERGYLAAQIFNARELTEAFIRADYRRRKAVLAVAPPQGAAV